MEPDELITVRVQYLVDSDPFNSLSMYPIPSRAPVFSFASAVPLATQLGALLRHLGAPQRLDNIKHTRRLDNLVHNAGWYFGLFPLALLFAHSGTTHFSRTSTIKFNDRRPNVAPGLLRGGGER
uniref:FHOD1 N-terminal GTPase-binding domain-containing protein n=1 Tax=Anopheles culicifacies TaxID=139723 RepID=A0A182MGF8_9DIPT